MKKSFLLALTFLLLSVVQINGQNQISLSESIVENQEAPMISAYEAYVKFKDGKAIILHAGGELYRKRHILGAFNVEQLHKEGGISSQMLSRFPKRGMEIFVYCY